MHYAGNDIVIDMNRYWFKPKTYGWGFVPISWEGWLLTFALIGAMLFASYLRGIFTLNEEEISPLLWVFLDYFILTMIFIGIAIGRTKGDVRFNWGKKSRSDKAEDQDGPIKPV